MHLKFYFLSTAIMSCWFFRVKHGWAFSLTALFVKMASRTTEVGIYSGNVFKMYKYHASVSNLLIFFVRDVYSGHCELNLERNDS
jgi:hypothetical protein